MHNSTEYTPPLDTIKRSLEEYNYLLWDITWCTHVYLIHHINQKKTRFHSNLIIYKHWNEEKKTLKVCKWIFQIVIAKCASITCIFNQLYFQSIYFMILLTRIFFFYSNAYKTKQGVKFFSQYFIFWYF